MPSTEVRVLLDTHVVLWWKAGSDRLSPEALRAITSATQVMLSPISCWEIAMLAAKDRIRLDRPVERWVADVLAGDGVASAPLTAPIAVAAAQLGAFHGDPADRFLVATAAACAVPLVTKDRLIHRWAHEEGRITALW